MQGLIIQCLAGAILACLLGLILHRPWFDILLQFLQNQEAWYLSEVLQHRPGLWAYLSLGLVTLFNFGFLIQLLKQFMLKEWDITAVIRGFTVVFTGLTITILLSVHLSLLEAQILQAEARKTVIHKLDAGLSPQQVRNYLQPLFPDTQFSAQGQQDLFSYRMNNDGEAQVYKVKVNYKNNALIAAQYLHETFAEPFRCEVLQETPHRPNQTYPYPCQR